MAIQCSDGITLDGLAAATYYKYFAQDNNPYIVHKQPLERIRAKTLYQNNKKAFDKFVLAFQKFGIDIVKYLKFLTHECGKTEKDIPDVLLNNVYFYRFADYLKVRNQYYKIYKYFLKSANNIADDCMRLGFCSTKDYLRHLIKTRRLVNEYVAGRISCYYLSAIQNFKQVIKKLDPLSRDEFSKILQRYDKYNVDVNEAFKLYKSCSINPIKFTDELIWKKQTENEK